MSPTYEGLGVGPSWQRGQPPGGRGLVCLIKLGEEESQRKPEKKAGGSSAGGSAGHGKNLGFPPSRPESAERGLSKARRGCLGFLRVTLAAGMRVTSR